MTVNGSGNAKVATRSTTAVGPWRGDVVEQVVDDRLHVRPQSFDPPDRERGGDQTPEPGVIGRIDGEHVPRERRPG